MRKERINVRVDEGLLEKIDSKGENRSEIVRQALKNYLESNSFSGNVRQKQKQSPAKLEDVIEDIIDRRMEEDIYPRLGKIYNKLDEDIEDEDGVSVKLNVEMDTETHTFYEGYTQAFETPLSEIASEALEKKAEELSNNLRDIAKDASWLL